MARVRFSRLSETDLLEIALYTLRTWGEAQTERYPMGCQNPVPEVPSHVVFLLNFFDKLRKKAPSK